MYTKLGAPVAGGVALLPQAGEVPEVVLVVAMALAIFVALVNLLLVIRALRSILPKKEQ